MILISISSILPVQPQGAPSRSTQPLTPFSEPVASLPHQFPPHLLSRPLVFTSTSKLSSVTTVPPLPPPSIILNQSDKTVDRGSPNHQHTTRVSVEKDEQSAADGSEADVVMEHVDDDEAGPTPPRPNLSELDHENQPLNTQSQSSPMEGLPSFMLPIIRHLPLRHARLPYSGPGRPHAQTRLLSSSSSSSSAIASALSRVLSETEGAALARTFTTRRQPAPLTTAPAPTANVVDHVAPNAATARPEDQSVSAHQSL
ncbi:hypothetical protein PGT21_020012 [Puccinia graminis f. sp. tritici]|uniref:Uncharacterized protein n=1 Tax=Puccinia graminis f. sp. tritici TaxID=56615 RepID=A0A5B0NCJ5_PUCGR|nr:hypothetical protein PGT21_019710 [Puccinia graminis f. sp. tritici]KAA1087035.1 hypothetical protein PGT21_020012 [Puccinia graminis f. sp. tritici]